MIPEPEFDMTAEQGWSVLMKKNPIPFRRRSDRTIPQPKRKAA